MTKKPGSKSASVAGEDPMLARIARTFASDRRVTMGKLFASHGLKVDGKIFAMVVKGRLVVKLPKLRVDELVGTGAGERFDPGHGRLMKEWAAITGEKPRWAGYVREALEYVAGL
jgi:TfoX/Sxy family transcriptional regulator of competence genes